MKKLILFSVVVLSPIGQVYAGCDTCIQTSAEGAFTSMQSGIQGTTSAVNATNTALSTLNTTIQTSNTTQQTSINLFADQVTASVSSAARRNDLALEKHSKVVMGMTDSLATVITEGFKSQVKAEAIIHANETYGAELAQPESGDIGALRAPFLKQGSIQAQQIREQGNVEFYNFLNDTELASKGRSGVYLSSIAEWTDDKWNTAPYLTKNQLSEEEIDNFQDVLRVIVSPTPVKDQGLSSTQDLIDRRIKISKLSLIHSVMNANLVDSTPTIPASTDDWLIGYSNIAPIDGKVSYDAFIRSESMGRLEAEGWFTEMKTISPAGLLREQVNMQIIRNEMLRKNNEYLDQEKQLLALLALEKLNKEE